MMVFINIIPANDVGKSQRVYAGAPSTYEDFYKADELPDSNIVLTDTFELISATPGSINPKAKPGDSVVYFKKPSDWDGARIHFWETKDKGGGDLNGSGKWDDAPDMDPIGCGWYEYIFNEPVETTKLVFRDNGIKEQTKQTANLDVRISSGYIWYDNGWHNERPKPINKGPSIHPGRSDIAIITQDETWQFGGMWYKNEIDMTKDFSMTMYVNLGDKWGNGDGGGTGGGDGITFTIQGHTNATKTELNETIGSNGAGLGAYSKDEDINDPFNAYRNNFISNALVLEFDTFYNNLEENTNDNNTPNFGTGKGNDKKFYGHIDLTATPAKAGNSYFYKKHITEDGTISPFFRNPTDLSNVGDKDLTDNRWRRVSVDWNANTGILTYDIAGYDPIEYRLSEKDIINTFGGKKVHWGFTGSTGACTNLQQVGIFDLPDQTRSFIEKLSRNITKDGEDATFGKSTIMKKDDIIEYQVTVDYPKNYPAGEDYPAGENTQDIIGPYVEDDLPDGLTYLDGSLKVFKVSHDGTRDEIANPTWVDNRVHLGDLKDGVRKMEPGDKYIITYQARVTKEGIFNNIATFASKYTNPITDTAEVYSGSITLSKRGEEGQALEGAEFLLTGPNGYSLELPREGDTPAATYKIDYLEPGQYELKETKAPKGYLVSTAPININLDKGEAKDEVFTNYLIPLLSKEQKNTNETDWSDGTTTLVGDNVDFKITAELPKDISSYETIIIKDELDSRLTYNQESLILTNNETQLVINTDYSVDLIKNEEPEANLLVITLSPTGIAKLTNGSDLFIRFSANLNHSTLTNLTDIHNKAAIEFTNRLGVSGTEESDTTTTIPKTANLEITKQSIIDNSPLEGAKFKLQIKSAETWVDFWTEAEKTSGADGKISWMGLPKGDYRLIETKAPEGYNLLANPIEFKVESDITTHSHSFVVKNTPIEKIPDTGGIGPTIFIIAGILLISFAIIYGVISYKKRPQSYKTNKNNEQNS